MVTQLDPALDPPQSGPAPAGAEPRPRDNPFQGLAYFEAAHAASFAGRGRDIQELSSEILRQRRLILYGRSGLGKTSLLLAGVLPRLREQGCKTVYVRALLEPARDLFGAVHDGLDGDHRQSLPELIARHDNGGPVVIVFDQFEEFFIRFSDRPNAGHGDRAALSEHARRERDQFLEAVTQLTLDVALDVRLVFSLREDWFAELESFEAFLPNIMRNAYRLLPLTAFGVREAITRALKVAAVPFEPPLVSGLVEQLADVHFDPAMLQVMCTEIWAQAALRSGGRVERLELADLTKVGNLSRVFARYLEQVAARIPAGEARFSLQVRSVLDAMITPQRTKRAAPRGAFLELPIRISEAELERVLGLLCEQGLARRDQRRDGPWYELIHERLIHSILAWLDEDAVYFQFRDALRTVRALSTSPRWKADPERLLNRGQLEGVVGPYKELLRLAPDECLFLLHSAVYADSDDTERWAAENPLEALEQLVRGLLDSEDAAARVRGAQAVARLPQLGHLREALREIALGETRAEVRRAAARAYARRVPDAELRELGALVARSPRRRALSDLAAEVLHQRSGQTPPSWGLFARLWIRRRLYQQRWQDLADPMREARRRVALAALGSALTWSVLVVPPLAFTVLCVGEPDVVLSGDWLGRAILSGLTLFVIGSYAAWRAGRRAIARAAGEDQEGQFAAALRLPELAWLPLLIAGVSLLRAVLAGEDYDASLWCALWAPALLGWVHAIARLATPSVWAARTLSSRWRWALLWSLGGTFGPALCLWLLLGTSPGAAYLSWVDGGYDGGWLRKACFVATLVPIFAPLVATIGFVGLATCGAVSPLAGEVCSRRVGQDPPFSARRIVRSRRLGLALTLAAVTAFLLAHGLRVFPLPGYEATLRPPAAPRQELEIPRGRAPLDTTFARLRLEAEVPHVVQYQWRWPGEAAEQGIEVFPPRQVRWLAVHASERISGGEYARIQAEVLPQVEGNRLASNDWQFLAIEYADINVKRKTLRPRWEGNLRLNVATAATRLELCFTGAVVSQWKDVELAYAAFDASTPPSSDGPRSEVTARARAARLERMLTRLPSAGESIEKLGSEAPCLSLSVDDGRASSALPAFTPREPGALLVAEPKLFAMFAVRGVVEGAGPDPTPVAAGGGSAAAAAP